MRPPRKFKTTSFADTTKPGDDSFSAAWKFQAQPDGTSHEWVVELVWVKAGDGETGILGMAVVLDKMLASAIRRAATWVGEIPARHRFVLRSSDLR